MPAAGVAVHAHAAPGTQPSVRSALLRPWSCGVTIFPAGPGGSHGDLDVARAVPSYLPHAEPLVEGMSARVDGERVKDEVLAFLPGLVDERADEAGADAAALTAGVNLDAGQVDLGGTVFDVEHADV